MKHFIAAVVLLALWSIARRERERRLMQPWIRAFPVGVEV